MENEEKPVKKPMTHEERLELADKLDRELDEFIEKLPRRKYDEGWPEDRWEEEMEKHPFFMTQAPKPGQELHPLYEGLQQLKYDPDENEPEELATSYKEDGNFNFKHKNYRLAVVAYTEAIKVKCGKPEIEATLFNNRAASHYFLKNYRSSLMDCESALKINPDYDKALSRAANCCFHLKQYIKAVDYCDKILEKQKDNKEILELRQNSINAAKLKERDDRKNEAAAKRKAKEEEDIIKEIINRGYNIEGRTKAHISIEKLEPCFPELMHNRVFLDPSSTLVWPVVFVYPEYKIMDYIQQFSEKQTFSEHLALVFESFPDWDEDKKYIPGNINIYFETPRKKIISIDVNKTLSDALKTRDYIIRGGTPSFIVMVRESPAEKRFLQEYSI
ncbi:tetratricopeptide repeat protein 4 [Anoplophora glabripennis]|uniref:tetratricopeptide repeat protein 4 n=1 Tax=Anoplophora glabripennis TaxID=217634 RepID=UPI000873E0C4|nr:tetratricopeptide repeat protein 4 [Anoplophora glabripennis]